MQMERLQSSVKYIFYTLTKKGTLFGVFGVVAMLSWGGIYTSAKTGGLEVHFFDVGQGDSAFIVLPDGRQILIDGGPDDKVTEKLNGVMPFWDRSIDIVIATHGELDHIGGLASVFEHYDVETIVWNGIEAKTETFQEFNTAMNAENANIIVGKCCMRFMFSDAAFFEILYPAISTRTAPIDTRSSQNDFSLVIRLVYGDDSFLFTGDVERRAEYEVASENLYLESDVLKVAHHGSKTSSAEFFLERVNPKVAIISAGRGNSYGHPYEGILQRLAKYDIEVRRTDEEGDILLLSNGDSF
jgi:competence protein ComEC